MAVLREWRRRGVGAALMEALLQKAREQSLSRVPLHAQTHAAGFYRRLGFSERGGELWEAGVAHGEKTLELSPPRRYGDDPLCGSGGRPHGSRARRVRSCCLP